MVALVPTLRKISDDAPRIAAARFGKFSWAFMALALITGIWGIFSTDLSDKDSTYHITLFIKLLLVAASGVFALVHSKTKSIKAKASTGALGLFSALGALLSGVILVN